MSKLLPEFPFAAIVGQEPLKTALILNAINPRIGGVLISGPRGSAKSTLARGLADILPGSDAERRAFVNLPLGTSEDRLTGSLDLQQVLKHQDTTFRPGLLAQADGGVLYVDEVNLLPDNLVDLLLDVAARGINVVERDGISHSHSARFMLIGTMNPDEGELRPQLLDRFGLCVELTNAMPTEQRIAVVQQRDAFERDPDSFCADYAGEQTALTDRIRAAQSLLSSITTEDWVYRTIADRCEAAEVEGLRADVTWHRAAQAHAAWRESDIITQADLDAVEAWVLAHRRNASATSPPPNSPPESGGSEGRDHKTPQQGQASSDSDHGQWGAMPPVAERTQDTNSETSLSQSENRRQHRASKPVAQNSNRRKGDQSGQRSLGGHSDKPDWFATLMANGGRWPLQDIRFKKARTGQPLVHLILLDTSGSTLGGRLLGQAKGLVQALAKLAYGTRDQLAVMGFGNDRVTTVLTRRRAPKNMLEKLDALGGGGGTPLRDAITQATRTIGQWQRQEPGLSVCTYLITDGRTRQSVAGLAALGDCVVIDAEQGPVKRGRADQIATQLGARYETLTAMEGL